MKKTIVLLLTLTVIASSFCACGKKEEPATEPSVSEAVSEEVSEEVSEDVSETQPSDVVEKIEDEAEVDFNIPAEVMNVSARFGTLAETGKSASEIAEDIAESDLLPFGGAWMAVEEGYLNGFQNEITGFKEGATFGPMIGSIPFLGYVFEIENEADIETFGSLLMEEADLNWNVCTSADQMMLFQVGNKVMFIMTPSSFEDEE